MRPHRQQPTRLPCPWDSPGKNAGVGCHFLFQCMKVKSESKVAQLSPTPSDPMDCRPTRLLRPWDFPGKSTGTGCHCLLQLNAMERAKKRKEIESQRLRSIFRLLRLDYGCVWALSHAQLFVTAWTVALQASLSMGFSRWEYWSRLSFPSPGDLPDSGIKPESPAAPALEDWLFYHWAIREALGYWWGSLKTVMEMYLPSCSGVSRGKMGSHDTVRW